MPAAVGAAVEEPEGRCLELLRDPVKTQTAPGLLVGGQADGGDEHMRGRDKGRTW